jgi:hypothetical protein
MKKEVKKAQTERNQPEVLAGLGAAAKAGGKKPEDEGLFATPSTAAMPGDQEQEVDAATKVLREGATKMDQGAAEAIRKLPDRAQKGAKRQP